MFPDQYWEMYHPWPRAHGVLFTSSPAAHAYDSPAMRKLEEVEVGKMVMM